MADLNVVIVKAVPGKQINNFKFRLVNRLLGKKSATSSLWLLRVSSSMH